MTFQAELIDIDFLWHLIDESYEESQDGDLITFVHPRRGRLTALQSGNVAMLFTGGFHDNRGLPATAALRSIPLASPAASMGCSELPGVVVPFPTRMASEGL